jgi:hypothetical protein
MMEAQDVAVIAGALLWVGEGGVGFGDLLEALHGGWVCGVQVGVVLAGEGVEAFFEGRGVGGLGDAEDVVM